MLRLRNLDRTTLSGTVEDVMGADPAPDDVGFAVDHFITTLPGCPAVGGECHLEDSRMSLDALYSKPFAKLGGCQIGAELLDGYLEELALRTGQSGPLAIELAESLVGR